MQMMLNVQKVFTLNERGPKIKTLRWFTSEVARAWSEFESIPQPEGDGNRHRLDGRLHIAGETLRGGYEQRSPQVRCRVCISRKHKYDVITICKTCPKKPGFCSRACQHPGCAPSYE